MGVGTFFCKLQRYRTVVHMMQVMPQHLFDQFVTLMDRTA
jgi:hypothetical protein